MKKVMTTIPLSCFVILAMFFIAFSNFSIDINPNTYAESSGAQASLIVDSVIDISAPSTVTLSCTPGSTDATAQLCTSTANIVVTTNNVAGYTLQMNVASGSSTALTNNTASPAATISTLSQAYASANFPVNYWGYTGGLDKSSESGGYDCSANYCPVLAYQSDASNYSPNHVIKVTDAPSNASTTPITFAGKVNTLKPSGTYSTSVTFTAIANSIPAPSMQDFDSTACTNTATDQTFILRDSRDEKEYTIAKLRDGNCWMTQNLALGSDTAITLTPANTNIASNFTLPASKAEGDWSGSFNNPEIFDYAGNYPSQQATNKYGNYYNWNAATAGTNPSSGNSQYDICPKNWRLPSTGTDYTTGNEFYAMLNNYIITGTWKSTYWSGVTASNFTDSPVSLVFSGEALYGQGSYGRWWSSTALYSSYASYLDVDNDGSNVWPRLSNSGKIDGFSVRCLMPGA